MTKTLTTETIKLWRINAEITLGETDELDPENNAAKAILDLTAELLRYREAAENPSCWEIAGQLFTTKEEALKPGYRGTPEPLYDGPVLTDDREAQPVAPREQFESLCNQFWNWAEFDEINTEEEPRLKWDGKNYSHRVTAALWRMYQAAPPAPAVQKDVEAVVGLLESGEWAEHCTKSELGQRLESAITALIGITPPAPVVNPEFTGATAVPDICSTAVNDAAWKLHDTLTEHGPLNGHQFNNLKGCFYEALKIVMNAVPAPIVPVMICDTCGHDADHQGNRTYKCDSGHAFHIRSEPVSQRYKLVPVEPTDQMIAAAMGISETAIAIYKRMLAAAPDSN